ncbi:MAG: GNAT family N-acetyltransferase [Butyrivibrio sp.]|nr:GNAT family N-acetyltransferase [Butyrivibrio sp.]
MEWSIKTFDELSARELYEILKSRAEIFVKEQNITYVDEDDVDYRSLHVFGIENGRVTAYLRAYEDEAGAEENAAVDREIHVMKIGRVLSLEHGKGIGTELMKFALREIPKMVPCEKICMDAQKHAVHFYERLGFVVTSDEYLEEGIVHVDMSKKITKG